MPALGKSRMASSAALRKAVAVTAPLPCAVRGRSSATRTLPEPMTSPAVGGARDALSPRVSMPIVVQAESVKAAAHATRCKDGRGPRDRSRRHTDVLLSNPAIADYEPTEIPVKRQAELQRIREPSGMD